MPTPISGFDADRIMNGATYLAADAAVEGVRWDYMNGAFVAEGVLLEGVRPGQPVRAAVR